MSEQVIGGLILSDLLLSLSVIGASLIAAWLSRVFLFRMLRRLTQQTRTTLDDALVAAVSRPLLTAIVIAGLYLSTRFLPLIELARLYIGRGFSIALSLLAIYTAAAVLDAILRWYASEIASKTETSLDNRMIPWLRLGTFLAAGALAILVALELVGIEVAPVTGWLAQHGGQIALILALSVAAIFVLSQAVPKAIVAVVARGAAELEEEARKRANTLARVLVTAGQVTVAAVAAFMVLSELGLNIAPVLAGVGVAGIAIGFGAQNLVRDMVAGLFIILENQYRVGDVVKVADVAGYVEDINLRRTVLRDLDGIVHIVPNGEIRVASNFTREWSRVNMNVSVGYGEDLDRVIAVINRVGAELAEDPAWAPLILNAPKVLRVDNLGDSGIEIKILGDTKPIRQWDVMGELRRRLKKTFDEEGIEIPWPHTKVYFGNWPAGQTRGGGAGA